LLHINAKISIPHVNSWYTQELAFYCAQTHETTTIAVFVPAIYDHADAYTLIVSGLPSEMSLWCCKSFS